MTEQEQNKDYLAELRDISNDRQQQKELMKKNGDNSHEMLSEGNYTDPQHFVYELLQNAEDESANKVCFELQTDKMIFTHDSKHLFELGDIIAISNFGDQDSPKRKRENAIGRYGIGFKSVLAITEEPRIQSGIFDVSIKDRFVPVINDETFKSNETKIILPLKDNDLYQILLKKFTDINGDEIIFLNSINELKVVIDEQEVVFKKTEKGNILTITKNDEIIGSYLLLSKEVNIENRNLTIKIIFGIENNKITSLQEPLYVFFPTKDETNLSFVLHAPFKLATHTREHIDKEYPNNKILLEELANLFAENLEMLRNKGYIDVDFFDNIFPFRTDKTNNQIYKLFYDRCLTEFRNDRKLIPANDNNFASIKSGMFVGSAKLVELLSKEQLLNLFERQDWISDKITASVHKELYHYLRTLQIPDVDLKYFLNNLDEEFLIGQSDEWLIELYKTFCKIECNKEKNLEEIATIFNEDELKKLPIIRTTKDEQVLPAIAFLPIENQKQSIFPTIKEILIRDNIVLQFVKKLGIHKPSDRDEIKKIIKEENNLGNYFDIIFDHWKDEKPQQIIDDIKNSGKPFLKMKGSVECYKASELYFPTDDLVAYFETKPDAKFVDLEDYYKQIDNNDYDLLKEFLLKLGVSELPRILLRKITEKSQFDELSLLKETNYYNSEMDNIYDKYVDGCKESIDFIIANKDKSKSINLFCFLSKISTNSLLNIHFHYIENNRQKYWRDGYFDSIESVRLRNFKWLITKDGTFVAPHEITIEELAEGYDLSNADSLIKLLEFKQSNILTEEQRIAQKFENEEDAELARQLLADYKAKQNASRANGGGTYETHFAEDEQSPTEKTIRKIREKVTERQKTPKVQNTENIEKEEIKDEDAYTKSSVDFEKKKKQLEDKTAAEIDELTKIEEFTKIVESSKKYSFAWFKALLQLELMSSNENATSRNKEVSITFGKIEKESGTSRTLILTQPNRYIPQHIEEFSGVPLKIELQNGETRNIELENFSVKEYTLKAKIKSTDEIAGLNFYEIEEGTINVKNAGFLLDALVKCFNSLKFNDEDNLKEKLPENIEFVFGPPGTGKTTHLATRVLLPLMSQSDNFKVLVLTPTNKAADVLTKRIMDRDLTEQYKNWLVRFGTTTDETIEKAQLVKDRSFNLTTLKKSVVISTMARFTYDTYFNGFGHSSLFDFDWDYIVVDEASMLHLPSIVFALYKQQPQKFIIAGDPFQIGPIAQVKQWKDENIYTMVELDKPDSFVNPRLKPHEFKVTPLKKQWRSIESIGEVFSKFTYNGILEHNRKNSDIEKIEMPFFDIKPLTFIKFPVSKYESIYRSKRLNNSSNYHIYSAIFAFEFVKYLADRVTLGSESGKYKIGVISPYRIQADIVNKLIASAKIPQNIDIQVGTVHGFQGDECKIIISLFNTPPNISTLPESESFVNKQNILNVSISRAEDYLFVLMPDEDTDKIENLWKINKIEAISKSDTANYVVHCSAEIEKQIFGDSKYIESATFSTTHQNVNIYSEVEKIYEVRGDDNAIDIQIKSILASKG
jgi:hypothetical protein